MRSWAPGDIVKEFLRSAVRCPMGRAPARCPLFGFWALAPKRCVLDGNIWPRRPFAGARGREPGHELPAAIATA
eukprot:6039522-Pyramimonas_sp.AAC.1